MSTMTSTDPDPAGVDGEARPARPSAGAFLRTAVRPSMLVLLLVFLAAAALCARLGVWQLERAYERGEQAERHATQDDAGPAPLASLLAPQAPFRGELVGAPTVVSGEFEDGQVFVEGRVHQGQEGFLVLAPLRVTDDGSGGSTWADLSGPPVLPVVRGWVPAPGDHPVPTGVVDVVGYLQASEAVALGMVSSTVTDSISSPLLAGLWGGPVYSGYLVAAESQDSGIALLDRPSLPDEGVNLQNLFYALQWWIFGLFAVGLWGRMVLDEARGGAVDGFEGWEALQPPTA